MLCPRELIKAIRERYYVYSNLTCKHILTRRSQLDFFPRINVVDKAGALSYSSFPRRFGGRLRGHSLHGASVDGEREFAGVSRRFQERQEASGRGVSCRSE